MEQNEELEKLAAVLGLGKLLNSPEKIHGGLLHKMYRVVTSKGTFAVKVLNSEIMKRPSALRNMIRSEKIAANFIREIPAVVSLEIKGNQVQELDGTYYMIFPWAEGASVFPPEITEEHCRAIGDILGRIHGLNVSGEEALPEEDGPEMYDWEKYLWTAEQKGLSEAEWCAGYRKAAGDIYAWNKAACDAGESLGANTVISHRDLDPKNVLWNGMKPYIIDWEAAGYVNPFQEFLEVVNYWTGDGKGGIRQEYFSAMTAAYQKHMSLEQADWDSVFAGSFAGMLGWLEYNLKRALGLEAADAEEIRLGGQQVVSTIKELYDWQVKTGMLKEWLRGRLQ
ncbi:MAG: phosphotransferase [Acetatifactor sp.]|nr:phosphotransferase [Acetatifactor sp.]